MKKRTVYMIYISLFVLCFSLSFIVYQIFIREDDSSPSPNEKLTAKIDSNSYGLANTVDDGVILQAWSWSFKTIKEMLPDIAYSGYTSIQTSPINACVVGGNGGMQLNGEGKWWYHYQPTDWTIGNYQLGTRDEFIDLCSEADKYGIKIIVDVVPNHTGPSSLVLDGLKNAVGGITNLYHSTGSKSITNYGNRLQCTMYAMTGLIDVDTENKAFQDYFIEFMNDCIECGADGFRFDTAKHIALPDDPTQDDQPNNFWTRIYSEVTEVNDIFVYGEVLQGDNDRITAYAKAIGGVTASTYGSKIRSAIHTGTLPAATMTNFSVGVDSSYLTTWVESHDNFINDGTNKWSDDEIVRGWAIITAIGEGTPLFFSRPYGSTAKSAFGTLNRIGLAGNNTFKDNRVVAVNRFHNAMIGQDVKVTNLDTLKKVLSIERGSLGCVLINTSDSFDVNAAVTLTDGTYIDKVANKATFTVADGIMTGTIPADSIIVLCNEDSYIELDKAALVDVETDDFTIYNDSTEITLLATDAVKATYSINGGEEITYTDKTKIAIGEGIASGDSFDLVLKGTNTADQVSIRTFTFVKKTNISVGTKIFFNAPDDWKKPICAYVYDESSSTTKMNAEWPGVEMTKESNGTYSYIFTEPWTTALVIFTDGTNQSPSSMEPGHQVINGNTYTVDE